MFKSNFTADVAQHDSGVHFYTLYPYICTVAHPNEHLLLCNGGKVASVIPCSANQILSSHSQIVSLIPFHTTRMVLPTNNIADIHCVQTKEIIPSLWLSHQTLHAPNSPLKHRFISTALCKQILLSLLHLNRPLTIVLEAVISIWSRLLINLHPATIICGKEENEMRWEEKKEKKSVFILLPYVLFTHSSDQVCTATLLAMVR